MVAPPHTGKQKRLTILGSTGSIGQNTLRICAENPDYFSIHALVANRNVKQLAQDAITYGAKYAVIADEAYYPELKQLLEGTSVKAQSGRNAVIDVAEDDNDIVMAAMVGATGLEPAIAALQSGATLALANKEALVCAGALMRQTAENNSTTILPVDSEHSAIFQLLQHENPKTIRDITLTASGGPFRTWSQADITNATPEQAINHPKWNMGAKISIDSATMMNKGLELIEAYHLFAIEPEQIEILVHPESIIHGLVTYTDGSTLSHMAPPDMRVPIAYALSWPERMPTSCTPLNLVTAGTLTFEKPDDERFPAIKLARQALKAGPAHTIALNAANEVAVHAFLEKRIGFIDIAKTVEATLEKVTDAIQSHNLQDILACDKKMRAVAEEQLAQLKSVA